MATVEAVLKKPDGTSQVFSLPSGTDESSNWTVLQDSLKKIQQQANDALSVLVDLEKAKLNSGSTTQQTGDIDEDEDGDDDEDDDDGNDDKVSVEPHIKKAKTR